MHAARLYRLGGQFQDAAALAGLGVILDPHRQVDGHRAGLEIHLVPRDCPGLLGADAREQRQDNIEQIEDEIIRRLAARGLRYRNGNLLEISNERGILAVNLLGRDLFPLVSRAELSLSSVRPMPPTGRADVYEVNSVVDVLTSVELASAPADNRILQALEACPEVADVLREGRQNPAFNFEVIVDYKGMSRPAITDRFLNDLRWQILTYAWLRSQQPDTVPVIAGVLIFVNELLPTVDETTELRRQVRSAPADTDVLPQDEDAQRLDAWRGRTSGRLILSEEFRYERALLVVPVTQTLIDQACTSSTRPRRKSRHLWLLNPQRPGLRSLVLLREPEVVQVRHHSTHPRSG